MVPGLTCSRCGRAAPTEPEVLSRWKHGDLALAGELDEATTGLLLCPACVAEEEAGQIDEGAGD